MLSDTQLKEHFDFIGNWDVHHGIFDGCRSNMPCNSVDAGTTACGQGGAAD
jgi:hypothetical protein